MANETRITMFFQQGPSGWSETWWHPEEASTGFYDKISRLAVARVDLLNRDHFLSGIRITTEGARRSSRLILGGRETTLDKSLPAIYLPGQGREDGTVAKLEGLPDQVRAALQLEIVNNKIRVGLRYMAGFPDKLSLTEPQTLNRDWSEKWWLLFANWRATILDDGWVIKALNKADVTNPLLNVQAWRLAVAGPGYLGVVFEAAAPFTAVKGDRVAIQGVRMLRRGLRSPNGRWIIEGSETNQALGERTVWLRGTEGFNPANFLTLGKVRVVANAFIKPTWIEPLRIGIHKRGRPFGSPVGRRSARA